jgi:hypothetical protein
MSVWERVTGFSSLVLYPTWILSRLKAAKAMQAYFLRCVLLLVPPITVAGMQVELLIDRPVMSGMPSVGGRMQRARR